MKFETAKTEKGNIGVSFVSMEKAIEQAKQMDENGNVNCYNCSGCSDCSRCSDCSDCSRCSGCSGCSRCSRCSGCSGCSRCSDCSDCSRCSDCSDCSRCSGCSGCSDCSRCSGCSGCSGCSDLLGAKPVESELGAPKVPVIEDIHKKVYAAAAATPDSLNMVTWHSCETTHCRAGWVVYLAGEEGKALEQFHNTELAAMLIYKASGYEINPRQFYLGNKQALEDMKRLAGDVSAS